ncbi:MAG: exonuclease SbcCD subunit D C-terminal domain-containing protein [Ruminococcus callidus]
MRIIRGKLEDLLTYAQPSADWIRAELTDETLVPYAMERLRAVYPNVLELEFLSQSERIAAGTTELRQCRRSPCWNWWIVFAAVSISMSFQSMRQRRR